jgi:hypothetical protein
MASKATKRKMVDYIDTTLEETRIMFETKSQSNAYIIGYLEGTLKNLRSRLAISLTPDSLATTAAHDKMEAESHLAS